MEEEMKHVTSHKDITQSPNFRAYHYYSDLQALAQDFNHCKEYSAPPFWAGIGEHAYVYDQVSELFYKLREVFLRKTGATIVAGLGPYGSARIFGVLAGNPGSNNHYYRIYNSQEEEARAQFDETFA
jgi:hypothetical protein